MKEVYKTTIVSIRNRSVIEAVAPDNFYNWELHSTTIKKNKIYYHWKSCIKYGFEKNYQLSEDDYKKSLEIVLLSKKEEALYQKEDNVDI